MAWPHRCAGPARAAAHHRRKQIWASVTSVRTSQKPAPCKQLGIPFATGPAASELQVSPLGGRARAAELPVREVIPIFDPSRRISIDGWVFRLWTQRRRRASTSRTHAQTPTSVTSIGDPMTTAWKRTVAIDQTLPGWGIGNSKLSHTKRPRDDPPHS